MKPTPEPLELTCPKCTAEVAVLDGDPGHGPIRCPRCTFRLDLDPALFEDGLLDLWPDEMEAPLR